MQARPEPLGGVHVEHRLEPNGSPPKLSHPSPSVSTHETTLKECTTVRRPRKAYTITKQREIWSELEHQRFLEAIKKYHRDWKKIEEFIGTKSAKQIRSHAQKYFMKVQKYGGDEYIPPARPKRKTVPFDNTPSLLLAVAPKTVSSSLDQPYTSAPLAASLSQSMSPPIALNLSAPQQPSLNIPSADHSLQPPQLPQSNPTFSYMGFAVSAPLLMPANSPLTLASLLHGGTLADADLARLRRTHEHLVQAQVAMGAAPSSTPVGAVPQQPNMPKIYAFLGSLFDPAPINHVEALHAMSPIDREVVQMMMNSILQNPIAASAERTGDSMGPGPQLPPFASPPSYASPLTSAPMIKELNGQAYRPRLGDELLPPSSDPRNGLGVLMVPNSSSVHLSFVHRKDLDGADGEALCSTGGVGQATDSLPLYNTGGADYLLKM